LNTIHVDFKKVYLRYGQDHDIFQDLTFALPEGSFHYLTGASGAGKSSLLKLMYLGHRQYRGSISIFGRDLINLSSDEIPEFRQQIGVVFQEFHLFDHLSALDNVALGQRVKGYSWPHCREKAQIMLDWIGLSHIKDSYPSVLSGGEQQRIVIARAAINNPKLLLADEPSGNLDDANAIKLMSLFEELNRRGTTILLATHNRDLLNEFPHSELNIKDRRINFIPAACRRRTALHA